MVESDLAELTTESPFERQALAISLSRWAPGVLGRIIRHAYVALPQRDAMSEIHSAERIEEVNLVLSAEQREPILKRALEDLKSLTPHLDDKERRVERRLKNMIAAGLIGKSAGEQVEMLKTLLPSLNFSRALARLMTAPEKSDLQSIFDILATEEDENVIASWLGYLSEVGIKELPTDPGVLLDLSRHENKKIRGEAISLVLSAPAETLGKSFVDADWSHIKGQERLEALCGTYLICKYGSHLEFEIARQRIVPQALPYLVEARGCRQGELRAACDYVHGLLDEELGGNRTSRYGYSHLFEGKETWRKIVAMDDGAIIEKMRKAATYGRHLGFFNIFPLGELVGAILAVSPPDGVDIWLLVKAAHRQRGVNIRDFDHLVFAKSDDEEIAKLRRWMLDATKNDAELAQFVLCLHHGHEDWLMEVLRKDLGKASARCIARGLTLAGFLDCTDKANLLWKDGIEVRPLTGWLDRVRIAAWRTYQRNDHARHWFQQYLADPDPDRAYGYLNLSNECVDTRSLLWIHQILDSRRENVPRFWLEHLDIKAEARRSRRKKIEDDRKRTLFSMPISGNMSPWL